MAVDSLEKTETEPLEVTPGELRRALLHPANGPTAHRHFVFVAAILGLWAWSLSRTDEAALGGFGLVTILPITAFIALAAILIGYTVAVGSAEKGRVLGTYVIAIVGMVHFVPAFVYEHLRFSWAWKHVGIVEFIQRTGGVDQSVAVHPVYQSWPGFFGINAWITDASNLESALSYASWAPVVFELLFLGALFVLFRGVTHDPRLVWTGILFFALGNWVGQDYFAPQALAFAMYLMVLAIVLRWYATDSSGIRSIGDLEHETLEPGTPPALAVGIVLTLALMTIASTHQITPIATIVVLAALRFTRVIRVAWPLVAIVLFSLAWMFGPAQDFVLDNINGVVNELGGVEANLENNLVAAEFFNDTQLRISQISRLLSALIAGIAALGLWRRIHLRTPVKWVIVAAGAPTLLVLLSSYGGEVLFRAYLFALPFGAFLAASLWFPRASDAPSRLAMVVLGVVLLGLTSTLLVADFGADNRQVFSDAEVAAAEFVFSNAREGALIVEGSRDYPRQHRFYELFQYLPLDRSTPETLEGLLIDPAARIAGWMSDTERYNGGFVIITQSQRESVTALGSLLSPTLDRVEQSLVESDKFDLVFDRGGARVFVPAGQR